MGDTHTWLYGILNFRWWRSYDDKRALRYIVCLDRDMFDIGIRVGYQMALFRIWFKPTSVEETETDVMEEDSDDDDWEKLPIPRPEDLIRPCHKCDHAYYIGREGGGIFARGVVECRSPIRDQFPEQEDGQLMVDVECVGFEQMINRTVPPRVYKELLDTEDKEVKQ